LEHQNIPKEITPALSQGKHEAGRYPRISIVVPSFNQGQFIGHTLESIISQNYPNLELIVVDGGSTDETQGVIKQYDKHIQWWVSEHDSGLANAINKGMAQATGEILAWLNSDDCLMSGALFRVAEYFMAPGCADVVYGHRVLINKDGMDIGKWIMPGHHKFLLTYADYIPQETMFWKAELWRKVGSGVDESFSFALDWDLIRRFIAVRAKFQLIPAFIGQFRLHDQQKTQINIETDGYKEMDIVRNRCKQAFSSHIAMQNFYYRGQRASLYYFLLKARLIEVLWRFKLKKIE
jgi:glycosyltransferase involved in cell wall biosynthesis